MPVSFNNIPQDWRMPLYWVETDPTKAGYPTSRLPALLVGTKMTSGTADADVPVAVPSNSEAMRLFGAGSMLAMMCETFFKGNNAQELWCIPIAPAAGQAATGAITVTHIATSAGVLSLYIAGRRVQIPVAATDTMGQIADNIVYYVNADPNMPVIASQAATDAVLVTLTCKWAGIEGNDIDVRLNYGGTLAAERTPVGLTLTLPATGKLTTGSGTAVVTTGITNMGDESYEYCGLGFNDSTTLTAFETEYGFSDDGRWGWLRQLYGHVFGAYRGTYAALMSYGPSNNSGVLSLMAVEAGSPTPLWCWAAAYTAKAARGLLNDPARPLQTLPLDGCLPAPKHQRFKMKELNAMSGVGLATQGVNGDGVPAIKRESTTYQRNSYGQGDDAYELVPTLATLAALFRSQRQAITSKFPRHKLADDGTRFGPGQAIVTPKIIKAELIAQYRQDEFLGRVENATAYKKNLIVERDPLSATRANILYPPDLVNQLRVFAVLAQFRLQYDRGVNQQV